MDLLGLGMVAIGGAFCGKAARAIPDKNRTERFWAFGGILLVATGSAFIGADMLDCYNQQVASTATLEELRVAADEAWDKFMAKAEEEIAEAEATGGPMPQILTPEQEERFQEFMKEEPSTQPVESLGVPRPPGLSSLQ